MGTAPPSFPAAPRSARFPRHAGRAPPYLLLPVIGLPAVTLGGPQSDTLCVAPAFTSCRPSGLVVCLSRNGDQGQGQPWHMRGSQQLGDTVFGLHLAVAG